MISFWAGVKRSEFFQPDFVVTMQTTFVIVDEKLKIGKDVIENAYKNVEKGALVAEKAIHKASGKTINFAPFSPASKIALQAFSTVFSLLRNIGESCAAATFKLG